MIEVHFYGLLRRIVPNSKASEDTILHLKSIEEEQFQQFIKRFGLSISDIGDCFINGKLADLHDIINDGDRVGIFPFNMRLIDGGMELKFSPHRR